MEQHCQPFNDSLNINNVDLAPWVHILPAHLTPPPPIAWHHFSGLVSADGMRGLKHGVECDVTHLPSISGAQGSHCQLARHDWVHTFADDGISQFVGSLFHALLEGRSSSASNWSNMVKPYAPVFLTRFDLFHGHMFVHAASDAASITNDAGNADCVFADDVSYMSQDNNHLHTHSNSHTYSNGDSHSCSSNHSSLTGPCIAATCSSGSSSSSTNCSDQHDHVGSSGMFIDEDEYNNMRYDSSSSSSSNDSSSSTASSHLSRSSAALPDVGILFHAAEYPQYDDTMFPYYLGYCQHGSSLEFDQRSMDLRNMLWFKGRLAVLDASEHSPLHGLLLHEGTRPLRTVYEEDFGNAVADILYFTTTDTQMPATAALDIMRSAEGAFDHSFQPQASTATAAGNSNMCSVSSGSVYVSF
eukprot:jgi/Chrzof1/9118/Cz03g36190.t1